MLCNISYHIIYRAYNVLLAMFDRIQPRYAENVSPSTPSANGALFSDTTMHCVIPLRCEQGLRASLIPLSV